MAIYATVSLTIDHRSGPELAADHVRAWLVADGMAFDGAYGGFDFEACSTHDAPDDCPGDCPATFSCYRATITSAWT